MRDTIWLLELFVYTERCTAVIVHFTYVYTERVFVVVVISVLQSLFTLCLY